MVAIVRVTILAVTRRREVAIPARVVAALLEPFTITVVECVSPDLLRVSAIRIAPVTAVAIRLRARRSRREHAHQRECRHVLVLHDRYPPVARGDFNRHATQKTAFLRRIYDLTDLLSPAEGDVMRRRGFEKGYSVQTRTCDPRRSA